MIAFAPVRTSRIHAELRELSIGDVIALCALPESQHEYGASELLRRIVEPAEKPRVGQVTDPRLWTVQERAFVIAHYIAHVTEGERDFPIGNKGAKFSDYLVEGADVAPEVTDIGIVGGDVWKMQPLLGANSEAIERLIVSGRLPEARHGWWVGAMAVQMFRANEKPFDVVNAMDAKLDEFIADRAEILLAFPESDFMDLLEAFLIGHRKLEHIFRIEFIDSGAVWIPAKEVPGMIPARFPVSSAISERATLAFDRAERTGD